MKCPWSLWFLQFTNSTHYHHHRGLPCCSYGLVGSPGKRNCSRIDFCGFAMSWVVLYESEMAYPPRLGRNNRIRFPVRLNCVDKVSRIYDPALTFNDRKVYLIRLNRANPSQVQSVRNSAFQKGQYLPRAFITEQTFLKRPRALAVFAGVRCVRYSLFIRVEAAMEDRGTQSWSTSTFHKKTFAPERIAAYTR